MTRFRGQPKSKPEQRDELLSAYLDGELSTSARARLEAQLASDPALRAELDVLRRTVAMVRDLPSIPAPHNFILPRTTAARPRHPLRAKPVRRSWAAPLLSAATAVVSLLFVAVLAGDLLLFGVGGMASPPPAEPMVQLEAPREAPAPLAPSQQVAVEAETVYEAVPEVEGEVKAGEVDEPDATLAEPPAPMPAEAPVEESLAVTLEVEEKEVPALDAAGDEATEEPDLPSAAGMGGGADGEPVVSPSVPSLPEDEESAEVLAISPTVTAPARAGVGAAEPTPGEEPKAEPTSRVEWEERPEVTPGVLEEQPEAGRISPRRGLVSPWRVLEIILGVSALVLALATIWAWRGRRR